MQNIFERCEKKYLITVDQHALLKQVLSKHMNPDNYGEYLVQNIYYDTDNWDSIRASIEKPVYKEKMRLRCYGIPGKETKFFLELKKKCKGIVYKRRIAIPMAKLAGRPVREVVAGDSSQIAREIDYYIKSEGVSEKIYISYQRSAFAGIADEGLRITFDTDIRFRLNGLDFTHPHSGDLILPQGKMLMEIKSLGGMPMWLSKALSEIGIFPTTFSKYGVSYTDYILKQAKLEQQNLEEKTERRVRISA